MPVQSVDIQSPGVLEKILSRATEILVREYGASHVVFHGSRLFGDPYPDSDIDLLVVKETDREPMKRTHEAEDLLRKIGSPVSFDVQVWTPAEVSQGLSEGQTYVGVALFNGRFLYGKEEELMAAREYFYNIKHWLKDAREHLDYGKFSLGRDNEIGAMDQLFQSTERYLKAFLMTKGIKVEMVHSLPGLLDQAVKHEPSWESLRETLEITHKWGRACHYPPRQEGEVRIVPTLPEVKELYEKLDPWLKSLDWTLERSIESLEKNREKKNQGLGY
ncbi:MAG: nucleotidyltransferase domain-containing protein [Nitrospirae bacterium]|nr:nucleotidyltransferase domain-containing protein [Nitrospirota bacterium]MCL5284260.1 nucleotidyltransferase domain-containing protein [Nitrospirota bacterium]